MIGIDTNVLVRLTLEQDTAQGQTAQAFFRSLSPDNPGFVAREVVVEFVWLLERTFKLKRAEIETIMLGLLRSRELIIEQRENLGAALGEFERGGAGLADQLIRVAALVSGYEEVVTFDKELAREDRVTLLA